MVADYNGWTDLPEAEREALDLFELGQLADRPLGAPSHPYASPAGSISNRLVRVYSVMAT